GRSERPPRAHLRRPRSLPVRGEARLAGHPRAGDAGLVRGGRHPPRVDLQDLGGRGALLLEPDPRPAGAGREHPPRRERGADRRGPEGQPRGGACPLRVRGEEHPLRGAGVRDPRVQAVPGGPGARAPLRRLQGQGVSPARAARGGRRGQPDRAAADATAGVDPARARVARRVQPRHRLRPRARLVPGRHRRVPRRNRAAHLRPAGEHPRGRARREEPLHRHPRGPAGGQRHRRAARPRASPRRRGRGQGREPGPRERRARVPPELPVRRHPPNHPGAGLGPDFSRPERGQGVDQRSRPARSGRGARLRAEHPPLRRGGRRHAALPALRQPPRLRRDLRRARRAPRRPGARRPEREPLHLSLPPPLGLERRCAPSGRHQRHGFREAAPDLRGRAGSARLPRGAGLHPGPHLGTRVPRLPVLRRPGGPGLLAQGAGPGAAKVGATAARRPSDVGASGQTRLEPMSPVPEAPLRITIAVCAYVLLVVWVTLRGLDTGLRRSGCAAPIRRSLLVRIGALLGTWFLAVTAAAVAGAWLDPASPRALGYIIPALGLSLVLWRAGWLQATVQALPPSAIPWLQTLRIGGGLTLFGAWASGLAPWGWVATAGTGDVLVGLGAAAVAALLGTGLAWSRSAAIVWN